MTLTRVLPVGKGARSVFFYSGFRTLAALYIEIHLILNYLHSTQHIMNPYKLLVLAIDIMMAACLGFEIKEHIDAWKEKNTKTVADPEPVTTD